MRDRVMSGSSVEENMMIVMSVDEEWDGEVVRKSKRGKKDRQRVPR